MPANLELSTCAGANGDRAAARTAGHNWSQDSRATLRTSWCWFGHQDTVSIKIQEYPSMFLRRCVHNGDRITNRRQHKPQTEMGKPRESVKLSSISLD